MAVKLCAVCHDLSKDSPYKCPACFTPYCSVRCCQEHRQLGCTPATSQHPDGTQSWRPLLGHTEDTLTPQQLEPLRDSPGLLRVLENPHVRQILARVDASAQPEAALKAAMNEPLLVELVDECLKVVQPHENQL